jgi:hypothetical protein
MTYEITDRAGTEGASLLEKSLMNFPTAGTVLEINSPRFLLSTAWPVTHTHTHTKYPCQTRLKLELKKQ